ncbi:ATP-binding cassette domain-containing protein, partial [Escherichia coli]|uniref:ATP-binding cassette domain-containing protein n=1 Tax=Escherichia coli TaxID=562 RepID=UPI00228484FA
MGTDNPLLTAERLAIGVPGPQPAALVKNISFSMGRERLALVGESGSGKTTLARLIARFFDATSGSVSVGGVDVRQIA